MHLLNMLHELILALERPHLTRCLRTHRTLMRRQMLLMHILPLAKYASTIFDRTPRHTNPFFLWEVYGFLMPLPIKLLLKVPCAERTLEPP